jgi:hypothetical protein
MGIMGGIEVSFAAKLMDWCFWSFIVDDFDEILIVGSWGSQTGSICNFETCCILQSIPERSKLFKNAPFDYL